MKPPVLSATNCFNSVGARQRNSSCIKETSLNDPNLVITLHSGRTRDMLTTAQLSSRRWNSIFREPIDRKPGSRTYTEWQRRCCKSWCRRWRRMWLCTSNCRQLGRRWYGRDVRNVKSPKMVPHHVSWAIYRNSCMLQSQNVRLAVLFPSLRILRVCQFWVPDYLGVQWERQMSRGSSAMQLSDGGDIFQEIQTSE